MFWTKNMSFVAYSYISVTRILPNVYKINTLTYVFVSHLDGT